METPVKVKHNAEWYKAQERLWKAEIDKSPQNEEAWWNYYKAVRYQSWFDESTELREKVERIMQEVAKAIPDTYTLYIMKYYHKGDVNAAPEMKKAIQMRPDNVEMYPDYVSYLMQTGDEELMADILKRWYNSGTYSPSLLNYAYNALSGMKANSLIFVSGDSPTFSKLLVQYGKNLFEDIDVICMSMMWAPNYRKLICERLSIPDIEPIPQISSQEEADKYTEQMMLHIIKHTRRPAVYFSTLMNVPSFKDKLYCNELLPERFGRKREYALGKTSGKANIRKNLEALGLELDDEAMRKVTARIIELGDKKEVVTQEDLPYIISDVLKHSVEDARVKLLSYYVTLSQGLKPMASLKLSIGDQVYEQNASGDGQYDAFVRALRKIYKETLGRKFPMLTNYAVSIPPGGRTDAFVQTIITWEHEGKTFKTRGLDADQTEAAIKATIKMLNIIE